MIFKRKLSLVFSQFLFMLLWLSPAYANQPEPWQWKFQEAATDVMTDMTHFNDILVVVMLVVTVVVFLLLFYVIIKFNSKANPVPSTTTHHTVLEIIWTVVPVIILLVLAVPSFRLVFKQLEVPESELTIKATGNQWYWSYEYPDQGNISFDSIMLEDDELKEGQPRLLATDNAVVLPVDTNIRLIVTASDVLHSWAIPSFGVKMDAVPGRLNETWFKVNKLGTYYGQCSELCGVRHGFMPIMVRVVEKKKFKKWVTRAKMKFAENEMQMKPAPQLVLK